MTPEIVLMVVLMSFAGAALGTFTGLVPGIHVNTLASVMLIMYPGLESAISGFTDPASAPILVSACIMSASVVHSFTDFVPSVFIGAPDPDEVLSVLPGHRLMMAGNGMAAVRAAAIGSLVGSGFAVLLAIPVQFLMMNGLADDMDSVTLSVLVFTLCVILINESGSRNRIWALALMTVSGALGCICMNGGIPCAGILGEGTLLFPLLTGLFGIPALLGSVGGCRPPEQHDDVSDPTGIAPGIKGVITGCIAGWYPGITATAGASLASAFTPEKDPARFISLVASIGTVTSVFSIITLSVSGSGRSGTVLVIKEIVGDSLSGFCSPGFLLMLLSTAVAIPIGYIITIRAGKLMTGITGRIDMGLLNKAVICFVSALVLLLTGPYGIVILAVSTLVGLIPVAAETDRIPLSGCLMIPVILAEMSEFGFLITAF